MWKQFFYYLILVKYKQAIIFNDWLFLLYNISRDWKSNNWKNKKKIPMMIISCKLPNNKMTPRLIFKRTNKKNINNENASKKTL